MTDLFSIVTARVLASDFDKSRRRRRMEKQVKRFNDHNSLCGVEHVGRHVAHTARQVNPALRIVVCCNDTRKGQKMRKAGVDAIAAPDFNGGIRIASAMPRPHVVSFLDEMLGAEGNLRVEEIPIPDGLIRCRLQDVRFRRSSILCC